MVIISRFPSCTFGGDDGNRTHDPLLAGQVLSQLSYTPIRFGYHFFFLVTFRSLKIEQQKISVSLAVQHLLLVVFPLLVCFLPICKYEISVSDISHSP